MPIQGVVIQNNPTDVKEFYEMVCFTHSLNLVRGERIKPTFSVEDDGVEVGKCRRDFADAIAYFCAYTANPDHVTAVALGRIETKIALWVASNANVSQRVVKFLDERVLNAVQRLAATKEGHLPSDEHGPVSRLLDEILQFTKKKIFKYYRGAITVWNKICQPGKLDGMHTPA